MGYNLSEDRALHDLLKRIEQDLDAKSSKYFDFQEFLNLVSLSCPCYFCLTRAQTIEYLKVKADQENSELELISAFVMRPRLVYHH
eukprot:749841-Hanusia_phi.AAC.6